MAKLGFYFGLCPLLDNKSLLGVTEDCEKGCVIVTLGKNIAVKYRLLDQKQIHSWRTKERFTSSIVYVKKLSKYVGIFNHSYLRLWDGDEDQLDKLKKYKFSEHIESIIGNKDQSLILFKNGCLFELEEALENRKELEYYEVLKEDEKIADFFCSDFNDVLYVGLKLDKKNEIFFLWTTSKYNKKYFKISLKQSKGKILKGYNFHYINGSVSLLTIWSDGKICFNALEEKENTKIELFGNLDLISSNQKILLLSLDHNYLAMYGANSNEEGATLLIYNTQFKVIQSKQALKMFSNDANLFKIDKNLFLPIGQNLAVIPFKLDMEQLAALVGSHKAAKNDPDLEVVIIEETEITDWGEGLENLSEIEEPLKTLTQQLLSQGLSENLILEEILEKLFEKDNIKAIRQILLSYRDISEKFLMKIMKYILGAKLEVFKSRKTETSSFPHILQPVERKELVDMILCKSFSDNLLIPQIRNELDLGDVTLLFDYFYFLMGEQENCLEGLDLLETKEKLIRWCSVLIDANYQRFLLSKDERLIELLVGLRELVVEELKSLESFRQVQPLVSELVKGKPIARHNSNNLRYSIEQLSLY